jgi:hypothetical protein
MRRAVLVSLALLASFCAGGRGNTGNTSVADHGAITVQILPNPIVATRVAGSTYDFPFEVVLRETGGHPVDIDRVIATVFALGGIQIGTETYDAAKIASLRYAARVPANGELRYRLNPRRNVTSDLLFQGVSADVRVDGHDDTGTPAQAATRVTVNR